MARPPSTQRRGRGLLSRPGSAHGIVRGDAPVADLIRAVAARWKANGLSSTILAWIPSYEALEQTLSEARRQHIEAIVAQHVRTVFFSPRPLRPPARVRTAHDPHSMESTAPPRAQSPGREGRTRARDDRHAAVCEEESLVAPDSTPPVAAHLVVSRTSYAHHGIYVGDGKVVRYRGLSRSLRDGPVEEVSPAEFARGRRPRAPAGGARFDRVSLSPGPDHDWVRTAIAFFPTTATLLRMVCARQEPQPPDRGVARATPTRACLPRYSFSSQVAPRPRGPRLVDGRVNDSSRTPGSCADSN